MAALSIEGVPLPVLIDSLSLGTEDVGQANRNQRGYLVRDRRRAKWTMEFTLGPKTLDEAMLYRSLLLGEGELWNTQSIYGSYGYALAGTGALTLAGGGNPYLGNGVWNTKVGETLAIRGSYADQSAVGYGNTLSTGATAIMWRRDESTGEYRVAGFSWRTKDTTVTVKREALGTTGGLGTLGTPQAYTGAETFAVSSAQLTITAAGVETRWSAIRVLPWYLKAAQIDLLIAGRNLFFYHPPPLPNVYVNTDLLPMDNVKTGVTNEDASILMQGELDAMAVQPMMIGGVWTTMVLGCAGKLLET